MLHLGFPGKPLAPLVGATGISKSLIERSWNTAMQVDGVSAVYVATDDDRIAEAARAFGAEVLMTSAGLSELVPNVLRKQSSYWTVLQILSLTSKVTPR